jgi:hypothetical protein
MPEQLPRPAAAATISDETQARMERLQNSRAQRTATPARRRHPAQGARIAAGGIALASMLGMVGAMGYSSRSASAASTAPPAAVAAAPPKVVVVIHQSPAAAPVGGASADPAAIATATPPPAVVAAAPIPLTAQPVVQQAPAAQAPIATTSGSR